MDFTFIEVNKKNLFLTHRLISNASRMSPAVSSNSVTRLTLFAMSLSPEEETLTARVDG